VKQQIQILFLLFWLLPASLSAQSVGLVMSGGGAKGLAHIGVIKALEENNIPIDYVAGTSIGAIVGGLYAMGYSPDEMADLIRSDKFRFWLTGDIEPKYLYYFKTSEVLPNYLNIGIDIKDSLRVSVRPPSSLISSAQMNYVFLKLFSQANAVSNNDFDSLFVPFRCVASNITEKKPHVFRNGDLGDAVRASMTFPFIFKPITIDGNLMFDGGIYNNFPVNVMEEDFNPGFMIGSDVESESFKLNESNVYMQLQSMIVNRSDHSIPPDRGITLKLNLDDVSLLAFERIDEIMQVGYSHTISIIDEIRQSVTRQVTQEDLNARRATFRQQLPELRFRNIDLTNSRLNEMQREYISLSMYKKGRTFGIDEFKKDYFKLLADKQISEIIPRAVYNPADSLFDLQLNVSPRERLSVLFGGNISTGVANQTYIGLNYKGFSSYTYDLLVDGQFGRIYNAGRVMFRFDLPFQLPLYFKLTGNSHTFNNFASDRIFYEDNRQVTQNQRETYMKFNIGMPVQISSLLEFGFTAGNLTDTYRREGLGYPDGKSDVSSYDVMAASVRYETNSLDFRNYPTAGNRRRYIAQNMWSTDEYRAVAQGVESFKNYDNWFQLSAHQEIYFRIHRHFSLGVLGEALYSSRKMMQNYTATLLQLPAFTPTFHSKTTFNKAFRANQYVAAGVKPIWFFNRQLHLRGEFYGFLPLKEIEVSDRGQTVVYSSNRIAVKPDYIAELALVLRIKSVSLSAFGNYYSSPENNFNFGVNFGLLLFNRSLIEK